MLKTEFKLPDSRRVQGSDVELEFGEEDRNCGGHANIDGRPLVVVFVTMGDVRSLVAE